MNNYYQSAGKGAPIWREYIQYSLEKWSSGRLRADSAVREIVSICLRYNLTYICERLNESVARYGESKALTYMHKKYVQFPQMVG